MRAVCSDQFLFEFNGQFASLGDKYEKTVKLLYNSHKPLRLYLVIKCVDFYKK